MLLRVFLKFYVHWRECITIVCIGVFYLPRGFSVLGGICQILNFKKYVICNVMLDIHG